MLVLTYDPTFRIQAAAQMSEGIDRWYYPVKNSEPPKPRPVRALHTMDLQNMPNGAAVLPVCLEHTGRILQARQHTRFPKDCGSHSTSSFAILKSPSTKAPKSTSSILSMIRLNKTAGHN